MATDVAMTGTDEFELPARKKPKISELPLSSVQRASIDGLLHTFKKKGDFDGIRKKAFQQYNESAQRGMFEASLRNFTTNEIEREPVKYLKPDRRIAAPLLEGAAARAGVYAKVEADVEAYIEHYMANAEAALRDIRKQEVGDEAMEEEIRRGAKTEEEYAAEAEQRRKDRAKKFAEEEKARKKAEAQERKKKELEALKKKQEELQKETERLQREQKRRAERDAWKAAEKQRERERINKFNEERERLKREADEKERVKQAERERRQKEQREGEAKRLEQEALDLLLREGKEMAEKNKRPELERSESMEPPPRLVKHTSAPRDKLTRDEMRSQGLMPTSLTLRKGDKPNDPASPPVPTGPSGDRRLSRARSPSPIRRRDDSRRSRNLDRRESLYRDISAEREVWKRQKERGVSKGEEGEVVEGRIPTRARSRSRDSIRRRRSRSPPRRDRSRSRRRYRSPARRERSRSPPGIDRYVPGGGGGPPRSPRRDRDKRDRDEPRRRRGRDDDRPKEIDRYVPGASDDKADGRRRERTRSPRRDRDRRERSRDRGRRDRSRERDMPSSQGRDEQPSRAAVKDGGGEKDATAGAEV